MNWMRWKRVFFLLSTIALVTASIPLALGKLRPSLEFTGGSRWVFTTSHSQAEVEKAVTPHLEALELHAEPLKMRGAGEYELLIPQLSNDQKASLSGQMKSQLGDSFQEQSFTSIGPSLGQELITKTIMALVLGILTILIYVWWQFRDWRFGLAAILAILHDSFILMGTFGWLGWFWGVQVDTLFVTALLTTLSFSVHDTIVVFDRVRELKRTTRSQEPDWLANQAMSQTLTRSLNNSLTLLFMLLALVLLGGESLRWFAAALFVGTLTGTYSSTFTALPLWTMLQKYKYPTQS